MTTPTGQISWSNIAAEFGTPSGKNLGAYRVNQAIGDRNWTLDTGVPTSGTIRFSDLRGKTCNVVVDYTGPEVLSSYSGFSNAYVSTNHVFDDNSNTNTSLTTSDPGRVTITAGAPTDPGAPSSPVNFTVSRDANATSTITFTSVSDGTSVSFSRGSNGSEVVSRVIRDGTPYIVTSSPGTVIRIGSGGSQIELDDNEGDIDWNDLIVSASGGFFYSLTFNSGTQIRYLKEATVQVDTTLQKHYVITLTDGTVVDSTVSNVDVFNTSGLTASDVQRDRIVVSKKEKINDSSFRVWLRIQNLVSDPPPPGEFTYSNSENTFCRSFAIGWQTTVSQTGGLGTARDSYDSNGVAVGGFRTRPGLSDTKKVYHLIRRKIGNGFSSGGWEATTTSLNFIIAGSGAIYGYGGDGGRGADIDRPGGDGISGGNALILNYNSSVTVESGGILAGGGGGGSGGGYKYNGGPDARGAGCGGGGGAGFPAGGAGGAGFVNDGGKNNNVCQGREGNPGSLTSGGQGALANCDLTGGGRGGDGGNGGNLGLGGADGENENTP
jgi:hypothetical protein